MPSPQPTGAFFPQFPPSCLCPSRAADALCSQLLSTTHVLAAVFRALNDQLNARLKSRNVHSEIVFSLSPNNNVRERELRRRSSVACTAPMCY